MISILTHSPSIFSKEYLRAKLKNISGQKRGPTAVLESLRLGLGELGVEYQIDPPKDKISDTVHVVSGIGALRFALALKKAGRIKKLIVGPNIVILPSEYDFIMLDSTIDTIIQHSQWTKDLYISFDKRFEQKVKIWPAGVADSEHYSSRHNGHCIIYQKNASLELVDEIEKTLSGKNLSCTLLTYGTFDQKHYHDLLLKSDFAVFLSASESQGIAMQEAWIRDVPTLVWNPQVWKYKKYTWNDARISAPYLNDESGRFFSGESDFKPLLDAFLADIDKFEPRRYCREHLTNKVSAQRYIDILSNT